MRRHILNLLTALSLLLCAGAAALRLRGADDTFAASLDNRFHVTFESKRGGWLVVTGVSNAGRIRHEFSTSGWTPYPREWKWYERRPPGEPAYRLRRGTVRVALPRKEAPQAFGGWSGPMPAIELAAPTWAVVVTTAVLPFARIARRARAEARALARWHRFRQGRCAACGYDLRGGFGRCSECGELPERPARPGSSCLAVAIVARANLLGWWGVIMAAIGVALRLFDDGSTDFPATAAIAERVLAVAGIFCGVVGGARASGAGRAAGVVATLLNVGLLWFAFLPRLNR